MTTGTSRPVHPYKVSRKHSPTYNSMVNVKWNITQKLDPTIEPSNLKQPPKIRMFSVQKSICPRLFVRYGPEILNTCSTYMSIPRLYLRGVLFTFAGCIWSYVIVRIHAYMSRRRVPNHKPVSELHTLATPPPTLLLPIESTTSLGGHDI